MAQVVDNILDIAGIQTGRKAPVVDSNRSLRELVNMMGKQTWRQDV